MRLSRALEDKKLDLRLRDKLLQEGKISKEEVNGYIGELPDDTSKATTTEKDVVPTAEGEQES